MSITPLNSMNTPSVVGTAATQGPQAIGQTERQYAVVMLEREVRQLIAEIEFNKQASQAGGHSGAHACEFDIDSKLANFWHEEDPIDDCAYRFGLDLLQHNYDRDVGTLIQHGNALRREIATLADGPQKQAHLDKLSQFLQAEKTRLDDAFTKAAEQFQNPQRPFKIQLNPAQALFEEPQPLSSRAIAEAANKLDRLTSALRSELER